MQPDRFTIKAQEAVAAAQRLASENSNAEVGPPHLLLALLEQEEGVVVPVVQRLGVDAQETREAARKAMLGGDVDLLFDDGISLAFWANGSLSRNCCRLIEGAFFEPAYFGDGIAIAVGRKDRDLRSQINDALKRIKTSGRFQELVDRYFPIKAY